MRHTIQNLLTLVLLALLTGCGNYNWKLPFVYRVDIQQGNVIEQGMVDQLKRGMDKSQARFIMGSPVLVDSFRTNRWEYVYTFEKGIRTREQRHLTLHFDDDEKLSHITGDMKVADGLREPAPARVEPRTVEVPADRSRRGLFGWVGRGSSEEPEADAGTSGEPTTETEQRAEENMEVIEVDDNEI
ncbi:MAG: outer membrane protein assembly factor BamE [Gammaproteobacteria bacterium]